MFRLNFFAQCFLLIFFVLKKNISNIGGLFVGLGSFPLLTTEVQAVLGPGGKKKPLFLFAAFQAGQLCPESNSVPLPITANVNGGNHFLPPLALSLSAQML